MNKKKEKLTVLAENCLGLGTSRYLDGANKVKSRKTQQSVYGNTKINVILRTDYLMPGNVNHEF